MVAHGLGGQRLEANPPLQSRTSSTTAASSTAWSPHTCTEQDHADTEESTWAFLGVPFHGGLRESHQDFTKNDVAGAAGILCRISRKEHHKDSV